MKKVCVIIDVMYAYCCCSFISCVMLHLASRGGFFRVARRDRVPTMTSAKCRWSSGIMGNIE